MNDEAMNETTLDTSRCPICGTQNKCVMADGAEPGTPCWCTSLQISRETLDRVPEEARNKACICPNCASQA